MRIPMPNEQEKNEAVLKILQKGLKPKPSLWNCLKSLRRSVTFKTAFWGIGDCVALSVTAAAVFAVLFLGRYRPLLYSEVFMCSPFIYIFLYLSCMWKEKQTGLMEMKMTCRYTLRHLTAFRMLFFSGASVVFEILVTLVIYTMDDTGEITFLRLLGISFSALFIYSAGMLLLMVYRGTSRVTLLYPAAWAALNLIFMSAGGRPLEQVLRNLPNAVFLLIIVGSGALYLTRLKAFLLRQEEGESIC